MKICKVCKTENEDQFVYCKNCGAMLETVLPQKNEQEAVCDEALNFEAAPVPAFTQPYSYAKNPYENISEAGSTVNRSPYTEGYASLVPVKMLLPEPTNPEIKTMQTVYVTPAQKAAIQYDFQKQNNM